MFVAVARLSLSIPDSGSLKSKRHVVHKVLDKVRARFNVSISEVADLDLWQRATIGIAVVANEHTFAQESLSKVVRYIEELYVAPVLACSTEVIPLGDELYGPDDGSSTGSAARGAHRTLAEAERESGASLSDEDLPSFASSSLENDFPRPSSTGRAGRGKRGRSAVVSEQAREQAIDELRERLRRARRASSHAEERDEQDSSAAFEGRDREHNDDDG